MYTFDAPCIHLCSSSKCFIRAASLEAFPKGVGIGSSCTEGDWACLDNEPCVYNASVLSICTRFAYVFIVYHALKTNVLTICVFALSHSHRRIRTIRAPGRRFKHLYIGLHKSRIPNPGFQTQEPKPSNRSAGIQNTGIQAQDFKPRISIKRYFSQ